MRVNKGYLYIGGKYAHRVVYEQHHGSIPDGYVIHHKDENPRNNDISNLEAMSRDEHQRHHASGRKQLEHQRKLTADRFKKAREENSGKVGKCLQCNNQFISFSFAEPSKFCSKPCLEKWRCNRFAPETRQCKVCNGDYNATKRFQLYCSKKCNAKSKVRTYRTQATGGTPRRTLAEHGNVQPNS